MINIPTQAISFNLYYSGRSASEDMEAGDDGKTPALLPVTEETPQFKNIFIRDVNCKGAMTGIFLQGLPEMNLENVQLENIQMEADYGLVCSDASGVKIKNLTLITKKAPVADFKNSKDVFVEGLVSSSSGSPIIQVSGVQTGKMIFKNVGMTNPDKQIVIGKEVPQNLVQVVK